MRMLLVSLAFVTAATGIAASGLFAPQTASSPADVDAFVNALTACTAGSANTPHPLMPSFIVEHKISGETAGRCGYSQTMPGKMTMLCALSADGRKALAADLKQMMSGGSVKGGTSQPAAVWMAECEIQLPNGSKIPAVTPSRGGGS